MYKPTPQAQVRKMPPLQDESSFPSISPSLYLFRNLPKKARVLQSLGERCEKKRDLATWSQKHYVSSNIPDATFFLSFVVCLVCALLPSSSSSSSVQEENLLLAGDQARLNDPRNPHRQQAQKRSLASPSSLRMGRPRKKDDFKKKVKRNRIRVCPTLVAVRHLIHRLSRNEEKKCRDMQPSQRYASTEKEKGGQSRAVGQEQRKNP